MPVNISRPQINIREKLSELERPVGITGQSLMASNTAEEAGYITGSYRKNLIINGDFLVDQRNSGNTQTIAANTSGTPTADRWKVDNQTDGVVQTATLSGDCPAGLKNALRVRCTTVDTSFAVGQYVLLYTQLEQRDLRVLKWGSQAASFSVVSFYARSTIPGYTLTFEYYAHNGVQISKSFLLTSTWQRYYVLLPPNYLTSMSDGVSSGGYINFWLASGSTYTGGTLNTSNWKSYVNNQRCDAKTGTVFMDTVNNDVFISGVQWEVGAALTPFEYRSYGQELALCQRYYERWSSANNVYTWYTGYGYNTQIYLYLPYKALKRTTQPTVYYSTTTPTNLINAYGNTSTSGNLGGVMTGSPSVSSYSPDFSFLINLTASTYSPYGTAILWGISPNQWIAIDAEL